MRSLRVCLCAVLLSVSVQGYNYSTNGWTMSGADEVSTVEGAAAVLPCTFTHPPTNRTLTGSVLWYKGRKETAADKPVFNCTYPGPGPSRCDGATQEGGGGRFRSVGNLRQRDASIMVERLSREDGGQYRCRVELSVGKFQTPVLTVLSVTAADGNGSVVNGTEGDSATLPCVFTPPPHYLTPHTVTWVRNDSYRHIVTFTRRGNGSWAAGNGGTRYEMVGDPEQGNASTQIKQLSVEDTGGYLCLVEFRRPDNKKYPRSGRYENKLDYKIDHPFIHLSQREVRLWVGAGISKNSSSQLIISVAIILVLLFILCVLLVISWKKRVHVWLRGYITGTKRSDPSSTSTGRTEQKEEQSTSVQDNRSLYDNVVPNISEKVQDNCSAYDNVLADSSEKEQPGSCTYASLMISSGKPRKPQAKDRVQGGQKPEATTSDVIYATVVMKQ